MQIAFYGDSITVGIPGASYVRILKEILPQHTFRNYSKINATPLSLYYHVKDSLLPADIAFIFLGVNDLLTERSWLYSRLRRQWAHNDAEFIDHYRRLLEIVTACTQKVITIPPLFIGEDFDDLWQQRLGERGKLIEQLTKQYPNAHYLDVRSIFMLESEDGPVGRGIGDDAGQAIWDALTLRTDDAITRVAASRNFYYTLDGVHLSVAGAQIVADACLDVISKFADNSRV